MFGVPCLCDLQHPGTQRYGVYAELKKKIKIFLKKFLGVFYGERGKKIMGKASNFKGCWLYFRQKVD